MKDLKHIQKLDIVGLGAFSLQMSAEEVGNITTAALPKLRDFDHQGKVNQFIAFLYLSDLSGSKQE